MMHILKSFPKYLSLIICLVFLESCRHNFFLHNLLVIVGEFSQMRLWIF
jgi:hypothetical protein